MSPASPSLVDVHEAARRLSGWVRRTPVLALEPLARPGFDCALYLKLESLQVTGSFKARGASNRVLCLPEEQRAAGLYAASGGNHGAGVAYAAARSGVPARIYVPTSTPAEKRQRLRDLGAEVVVTGEVWDDAHAAATAAAERAGGTYVHPFADPEVIAGQGTVALELHEEAPLDTLLVAIGGGGLISGCALVTKALRPGCKVVGVEPQGAATLHDSLEAGELVTLAGISTQAGSLAPRRSAELNLSLIREHVDEIVLVSDATMEQAARYLYEEAGLAAELAGAAGLAALFSRAYVPEPGERVGLIVCGMGRPPR